MWAEGIIMFNLETVNYLSKIQKPSDIYKILEKKPLYAPIYDETELAEIFLMNARRGIEWHFNALRRYKPNAKILRKEYELFLFVERDKIALDNIIFVVDNFENKYPNIIVFVIPQLAFATHTSIASIYERTIVPYHLAFHYVTFYSQIHTVLSEVLAQLFASHNVVKNIPRSAYEVLRDQIEIREFPWRNSPDEQAVKSLIQRGIREEDAVAYYEGAVSAILPSKKGFLLMDEAEYLYQFIASKNKLEEEFAKIITNDKDSMFNDIIEVYDYFVRYTEKFEDYELDYEIVKPLEVLTNK